jgi:transcriptional regulator with XRE-family HTH domain
MNAAMTTLPQFSRLPATMENADIGPYLRSLREHYKLSLDDVGERLHIRPKYIAYIEASDLNQLPGKVYARGYIYNYAEFLGVDPAQVVDRFFGPTPVTPEAFYVPVRTPNKGPINARVLAGIAVLGLLAYGAYSLIQTADITSSTVAPHPTPSTVMPLPSNVVAGARNSALPNTQGAQCLHQPHGLDCGVLYRPTPILRNPLWAPAP